MKQGLAMMVHLHFILFRKLNHKEVAEEDMRKKLPKNYEAMRRKAEWEVADKQARQVMNVEQSF